MPPATALAPRTTTTPNGHVAVTTTDGHSLTWDDLVGQYAPAIAGYARSRGIREPDDIVQEVLATAVDTLGDFDGDSGDLRSWLFMLAYRRIADRHRRFYRSPLVLVGEHEQTPADDDDLDVGLLRSEACQDAMAAFQILDDRQRRVLQLRIIDERSPREVAEELGLSPGNVRVIQSRALARVRRHLENRTRTREQSAAGVVVLVAALRDLGTGLPTDGLVGAWIDLVRATVATARSTGAALPTAAAATPATAVGTTSATALAAPAVGGGTALKLGAITVGVALTAGAIATPSGDAPTPRPEAAQRLAAAPPDPGVAVPTPATLPTTRAQVARVGPAPVTDAHEPSAGPDVVTTPAGTAGVAAGPAVPPRGIGVPVSHDDLAGPDGASTASLGTSRESVVLAVLADLEHLLGVLDDGATGDFDLTAAGRLLTTPLAETRDVLATLVALGALDDGALGRLLARLDGTIAGARPSTPTVPDTIEDVGDDVGEVLGPTTGRASTADAEAGAAGAPSSSGSAPVREGRDPTPARNAAESTRAVVQDAVDDAGAVIDEVTDVADSVGDAGGDAPEAVGAVGGEVADVVGEVVDDVGEVADDVGEVVDDVGEVVDDVGGVLDGAADTVTGEGSGSGDGLLGGLGGSSAGSG